MVIPFRVVSWKISGTAIRLVTLRTARQSSVNAEELRTPRVGFCTPQTTVLPFYVTTDMDPRFDEKISCPTNEARRQKKKWQYWILAAISRCCSWCLGWIRYGRNFNSMSTLPEISHFARTVFSKIYVAIALVFLQRCRASHLSTLSDNRHVSCHKHILCPKILLPVCVIWSY
jgi:hypothetical protein